MLVEIFECVECNRRVVRIAGKPLKGHNCSGSLKLMADAEVSTLRLRDLLKDLLFRGEG
jgi:hypothetical protein